MYKNLEFVFDCIGFFLAVLMFYFLYRYVDVVINYLWNLFGNFIGYPEMIIFQTDYFVFN